MNITPRIMNLSQKQLTQVSLDAAKGRNICADYAKFTSGPVSYENLDKVFKAWVEDKSTTKASNEEIASGIGCLFGELLKAEFCFGWQMIEDPYGCELALVDENTGSVVYPVNSVWKRIEPKSDTTPFFQPMHDSIKQHLDSLK